MDANDLAGVVRFGDVSSVNKTKCTARVNFRDRGIVSGELKIPQKIPEMTVEGKKIEAEPWMPKVGDTVMCVFTPGSDDGFIMGGC